MALKTKETEIQSSLITKQLSQTQNKKRTHKRQTKPEFKLRRRKDHNSNYTQGQSTSSLPHLPSLPSLPTLPSLPNLPMATFYPPIYPIYNEWSPIFPLQCPVPVPILVNTVPGTHSPIFQYITPVVSPHIVDVSPITNYSFEEMASPVEYLNSESTFCTESSGFGNDSIEDPMEYYLSLPKNLFPSPRMLSLDPNSMIDEFCKLPGLKTKVPWILDLEFGIPKVPVTRHIPIYNVKLNSINCKNTPDAIHPGFENCNEDFKKVILFYYDCIVSSWYKGYMLLNSDRSVDNFQSWLSQPMQELGMCWS